MTRPKLAIAPLVAPLAPVFRNIALTYYRWARHDMTIRNPAHPDMGYVLNRIAELEAA